MLWVVVIFLANIMPAESENILASFTIGGSHIRLPSVLFRRLLARGHNVTTMRVSSDPFGPYPSLGTGHKEIIVPIGETAGFWSRLHRSVNKYCGYPVTDNSVLLGLCHYSSNMPVFDSYCSRILGDEKFIEVLRRQNFTLAFSDLFSNDCFLALAHHLGIPVTVVVDRKIYFFFQPKSERLHNTANRTISAEISEELK